MNFFKLNYIFLYLLISFNAYAEVRSVQSLKTLGYTQGLVSNTAIEEQTLYFQVPDKKLIASASLKLNIEYSSLLEKPSNIRVYVDKTPIGVIHLTSNKEKSDSLTKKSVSLSIPEHLLNNSQLPISFQFTQVITGDSCMDAKFANAVIYINPESALDLVLTRTPYQINDYLISLPEVVHFFVPKRMSTEQEFKHIVFMQLLVSQLGKKAVFTQNIKNAHIVLGNNQELKDILNDEKTNLTDLIDIYAYKDEKQFYSFLGINSSIEGDIRNLNHFSYRVINQKNLTLGKTKAKTISDKLIYLNQLGISPSGQKHARGQTWQINIPNKELYDSLVPKKLNLSVITTPSHGAAPVNLYIFMDEMLLKVHELNNAGDAEFVSVELPQSIQSNSINLTLQIIRSDSTGKCGEGGSFSYPASILPDSHIELESFNQEPMNFMEFARLANQSLVISLPNSVKSSSELWSHHLNLVIKSLNINISNIKFDFYDKSPNLQNEPHLIIHNKELFLEAPVSTHNEINVYGNSIEGINAHDLRNIFVMQLARMDNKKVLSYQVLSSQTAPSLAFLNIDRNDVTIFEHERILASFLSKTIKPNQASFSDKNTVKILYQKYRYYLFALLWLIGTLLFIRIGKVIK